MFLESGTELNTLTSKGLQTSWGEIRYIQIQKDNQVMLCLVNAKETEQVIYATEELREIW